MAYCCAAERKPQQTLSEVLKSTAGDPTLQECCARDLREQAYSSWLKAELLATDRINTRRDIAGSVIRSEAIFEPTCKSTGYMTSEDEEAGSEVYRGCAHRLL